MNQAQLQFSIQAFRLYRYLKAALLLKIKDKDTEIWQKIVYLAAELPPLARATTSIDLLQKSMEISKFIENQNIEEFIKFKNIEEIIVLCEQMWRNTSQSE